MSVTLDTQIKNTQLLAAAVDEMNYHSSKRRTDTSISLC